MEFSEDSKKVAITIILLLIPFILIRTIALPFGIIELMGYSIYAIYVFIVPIIFLGVSIFLLVVAVRKSMPYWLRGVAIGVILYTVLGSIVFVWELLTCARLHLAGESIGMCGLASAIIGSVLLIVIPITAIIGGIYGKNRENKGKSFLYICLFLLAVFIVGFWFIQGRYLWYNSIDSASGCRSVLTTLGNFDKTRCYQEVAERNKDIEICNNIHSSDDFKWFCYEEVAHVKNDAFICELIPEKTYNEHNVLTGRRDACFVWFKLCDRISDSGWKENCLQSISQTQ